MEVATYSVTTYMYFLTETVEELNLGLNDSHLTCRLTWSDSTLANVQESKCVARDYFGSTTKYNAEMKSRSAVTVYGVAIGH